MAAEAKESKYDKVDNLAVNTVRVLAADMVEKANSGHPGAPMGLAPVAHVLWSRIMNGNPKNPKWVNRDRFVLSNGHACALQYSMLHLNGYKVSMDDLKSFRQINSITPGHPECGMTEGIEVSTGPLGQGIAQAVGLAIAGKHLGSIFNKDDISLFDSNVYCVCGDGCMQEGVASEAASLAGHLQLSNLILLYDDNSITIDGKTELSFTETVIDRFKAYGWQTYFVENGNEDFDGIEAAILDAQTQSKPCLIQVRTNIGYKSSKQDTHGVHGSPLGAKTLAEFKKALGFDGEKHLFTVSDDVYNLYKNTFIKRGENAEAEWNKLFSNYCEKYKSEGEKLKRMLNGELPKDWISKLPKFDENSKSDATRNINGNILNVIADNVPELMGGSADLTPSTKTDIKKSHDFQAKSYDGRYLRFGIREFGMIAICNGISAFGCNLIPFSSTFLVFITYGWGAVRLGALSHLRQIYVMTHDSIFLGEDGPTHQPIEVLPLLRATPNVLTFRPCDGNEINAGWIVGMQHHGGTVLCLSRQNIKPFKGTSAESAQKGAYIVCDDSKDNKCDAVMVSSGSEVWMCVDAAKELKDKYKLSVRVVSAPCLELFDKQSSDYKKQVLFGGDGAPVISVEASSSHGWTKYSHSHVAVDRFGASAPLKQIEEEFGFTPSKIAQTVNKSVSFWKANSFKPPMLPCFWQ